MIRQVRRALCAGRRYRHDAPRAGRRAGRRDRRLECDRAGRDRSAQADGSRAVPGDRDGEGAVYDAVNAIDRGYQPYLIDLHEVGAQPWARRMQPPRPRPTVCSERSSHRPATPARRGLPGDPGRLRDPLVQEGIDAGEAAAAAMLASRTGDGFLATFVPSIGLDPGDWRPSAGRRAGPRSRRLDRQPEAVPDREPVAVPLGGPERATSAAYAEEYAEVKELGAQNSSTRTADQTAAAVFWQFAPIALWNPLARDLANRYELDTADQARLYAMVNLAAVDGAIACWNDKYYWSFWRPRAAIREGDTDGNPATIGDPTWESLFAAATMTTPPLGTPPFPDHPSGPRLPDRRRHEHDADFFGTDKVAITWSRAAAHGSRFAAAVRPLLARDEGGDRRTHLGRDPLPHRRRAGNGDREEGRPLAPQALLPTARMRSAE